MKNQGRRRFIVGGIAGAGVVVAAAAAWSADARAKNVYDAKVRQIWRHSQTFDPPQASAERELVRYATLAANSHNTQPWRFRVQNHSISILPDLERRLAAVDPDDHHLFASLGCAAENIVQAAPAFGIRAIVSFEPPAGGLRVDLEKEPAASNALFEAIPNRRSTRSLYDGRPVPAERLKLLEAAGNEPGVEMRMFTERKPIEDILGYLLAGDAAQIDDPAFMAELKRWIRFNYAEALASDDGLFSKSTDNPAVPGWMGRALFGLLVTKAGDAKTLAAQLRNSAGVVVFISDANEPASWAAAGRCSQRFALQATALGIQYCFINQPVEVPAVRGQFASYLGIGARRPDLVMRFGYGSELPRSLRRDVDQVMLAAPA